MSNHVSSETSGPGWLHDTAVERRSLAGELTMSCARPVAVGKPSAIGQPTRPTQPFIPSGSIDEYAATGCLLLQLEVPPSGEGLRRKGRHGVFAAKTV